MFYFSVKKTLSMLSLIQSSMESVITTLDPGMREIICKFQSIPLYYNK